jgi:hypothetical protein
MDKTFGTLIDTMTYYESLKGIRITKLKSSLGIMQKSWFAVWWISRIRYLRYLYSIMYLERPWLHRLYKIKTQSAHCRR